MWASPPGWACCGLNTSSMPPPGGDASSVSSHDRGDFHLATGDYPDRPPPLTFIRPPAYTFAWPGTIPGVPSQGWTGSVEPYKRYPREVGKSGAGVGAAHSTDEAG